MPRSRIRYLAAALSAAALWGFISVPMRNMHSHSSEQILYYRVLCSLIIVWIVIISGRRQALRSNFENVQLLLRPEKVKLLFLILTAGVLITLNWFTFIYVINHISLQSGVFAYLVCPIITALLGFLLLREQLSRLKIVAISMAFISISVMATGSLREVAWSVAVALTYAGYLIIQRVTAHIDRFTMLGVQLIISSLFLLPFFIIHFEPVPIETSFWINTLALAVIFTIIPLFLSMYALTGVPSSTVGITIYLNPIIAFGVAVLYFHDPVDRHKLWGYLVLLFSVILFNWNVIHESIIRKRVTEPVA